MVDPTHAESLILGHLHLCSVRPLYRDYDRDVTPNNVQTDVNTLVQTRGASSNYGRPEA